MVQELTIAVAYHLDAVSDQAAGLVLAWVNFPILFCAAESEQHFRDGAVARAARTGMEYTPGGRLLRDRQNGGSPGRVFRETHPLEAMRLRRRPRQDRFDSPVKMLDGESKTDCGYKRGIQNKDCRSGGDLGSQRKS